MAIQTHNLLLKLGVRQKVILVLVTVLLSALTVSGWLALVQERNDAIQEIHQRGTDITRFVAKSLAYSVIGYDYHTIQLLLDEVTESDIVAYAKVTSANGKVMAEAGSKQHTDDVRLLTFTDNISLNGDVIGVLTAAISPASTLQRLESQKYSQVKREAFIILLIAVGEFLALSFLIIRPVRIMSVALRKSVSEDGGKVAELPVISNDEFGTLAREFNALGAQLNEANEHLRNKVVSADEQLRETNKELLMKSNELQRINREFERLSVTDVLTGLYNRRHFENLIEDKVSAALRSGTPVSLLLIDVDHFKRINDSYGHAVGDMVLKEVAQYLKNNIRLSDTLCRLGGEEFIAICENAGCDDALKIAEKLRLAVADKKFNIDEQSLEVSVSVGIATIPDNYGTGTTKDFYHCADIALYQSKETGRNRITHYVSCA